MTQPQFFDLVRARAKRLAVEVTNTSGVVGPLGRLVGYRVDLRDWQTRRRGWIEFDVALGEDLKGHALAELIDSELEAFRKSARRELA